MNLQRRRFSFRGLLQFSFALLLAWCRFAQAADSIELHAEKNSYFPGRQALYLEDNIVEEFQHPASCFFADNGKVALGMLQQAGSPYYDLVLMDMQMPVMDGVTATRAIRALLPVIAMTANTMQADRERCIEAGMNDYVAKPIEPDELWKALLKWIKPRRAPSEGSPQQAADIVLPDQALLALQEALQQYEGLSQAPQ